MRPRIPIEPPKRAQSSMGGRSKGNHLENEALQHYAGRLPEGIAGPSVGAGVERERALKGLVIGVRELRVHAREFSALLGREVVAVF